MKAKILLPSEKPIRTHFTLTGNCMPIYIHMCVHVCIYQHGCVCLFERINSTLPKAVTQSKLNIRGG